MWPTAEAGRRHERKIVREMSFPWANDRGTEAERARTRAVLSASPMLGDEQNRRTNDAGLMADHHGRQRRDKAPLARKGGRRLIPISRGDRQPRRRRTTAEHHSRRSLLKLSRADCPTFGMSEEGDGHRSWWRPAPAMGGADEPNERKFRPGGSADRIRCQWPNFWPNGRIRRMKGLLRPTTEESSLVGRRRTRCDTRGPPRRAKLTSALRDTAQGGR